MKPAITISVLLVIFAVLFPFFTALNYPLPIPLRDDEISSGISDQQPEKLPEADSQITVRVLTDGHIELLPLSEYLIGVVSAEMPASFEPEALKAQAVAARTYTLHKMLVSPSQQHPEADTCSDVNCCKAYASEEALREKWGADFDAYLTKITSAVTETDGECLIYDGEPILAVFHSSSCGATENSENVWSASLPYLQSAASPETAADVPGYFSTVQVSFSDFTDTILSEFPSAVFGDDKSTWVTSAEYTDSGRLKSVSIGGINMEGTQVRTLFGLRSAAVEISVTDVSVIFRTTGYGHGVGMSQYGANVMAKGGSSCREILLHYYPGTTLTSIDRVFKQV